MKRKNILAERQKRKQTKKKSNWSETFQKTTCGRTRQASTETYDGDKHDSRTDSELAWNSTMLYVTHRDSSIFTYFVELFLMFLCENSMLWLGNWSEIWIFQILDKREFFDLNSEMFELFIW